MKKSKKLSALAEIKGTDPELEKLELEMPALVDMAREEGAKAERERSVGIIKTSVPGFKKIIDEMLADGKTTPEQAALRIHEAMKAKYANSHELQNAFGDVGRYIAYKKAQRPLQRPPPSHLN